MSKPCILNFQFSTLLLQLDFLETCAYLYKVHSVLLHFEILSKLVLANGSCVCSVKINQTKIEIEREMLRSRDTHCIQVGRAGPQRLKKL